MWLKTEESLTDRQIEAGHKNIVGDGIASQAMGILTGGAFLIAFAIRLGASNMIVGPLAAIGPLRQMISFQLAAIRNITRMVASDEKNGD